ncbi:MAG: hypothetical protein ACXW32_17480, partial [Limisphaerales bacterium]
MTQTGAFHTVIHESYSQKNSPPSGKIPEMIELPPITSPTVQALRRITQARQILEEVVISSESFDYRKARQGLKDLQGMIRELGREEARLRAGAANGVET